MEIPNQNTLEIPIRITVLDCGLNHKFYVRFRPDDAHAVRGQLPGLHVGRADGLGAHAGRAAGCGDFLSTPRLVRHLPGGGQRGRVHAERAAGGEHPHVVDHEHLLVQVLCVENAFAYRVHVTPYRTGLALVWEAFVEWVHSFNNFRVAFLFAVLHDAPMTAANFWLLPACRCVGPGVSAGGGMVHLVESFPF